MKVGILTLLPLNSNYGGILQAWALQKFISDLGYDVIIFNTPQVGTLSFKEKLFRYPLRVYKRYVLGQKIIVNFESKFVHNRKKIIPFVENKILTKIINRVVDINPQEYDYIIFGSDQVWRALYWCRTFPNISDAFGAFVQDTSKTKLISYAASFGKDNIEEYPQEKLSEISLLLKRFRGISVREKSGVDICNRHFDVNAKWVMDPTMLHSIDVYEDVCKEIPIKNKFIASYFLEESELSKKIEEKILGNYNGSYDKIKSNVLKAEVRGIEDWLATFRDAEFIMTDSFHGSVFSIIFGKPFIVLDNPNRGTGRIKSLLQLFNIENHFIESVESLDDISSYCHKEKTSQILTNIRYESSSWLQNSLGEYN